jgi:putative Mn2+ efflux pump MntP
LSPKQDKALFRGTCSDARNEELCHSHFFPVSTLKASNLRIQSLWVQLVILGVVIGFNNFAAALALGSIGQESRTWRILTVFAVFEFCVPLIGLWLGQTLSKSLAIVSAWLGPLLLAGLGLLTLVQSTSRTHNQKRLGEKVTSWGGLFLFSAGLSLDNLVVGFSLGLRSVPALALATTIMVFSVSFAWIGITLGGQGRKNYENMAEAMAGILLLGVAGATGLGIL